MSITDELREYSKTATASPAVFKELTDIADLIDKRHAKARDKAYDEGVCDGIDADKNAMGYIKLPVDADGEPIHIGDVVIYDHDGVRTGTPETVKWIAMGETEVHISTDRTSYAKPSVLRHHHEPTVEDVLREFAEKMNENMGMYVGEAIDADEWRDADRQTIAEYASKLRLAGEVE